MQITILLLREVDEIADRLHRKIRIHGNSQRSDGNKRNRREVADRVVWKILDKGRIDRVGHRCKEQRVTIRISPGHGARPQHLCAAAPVVDRNRLLELLFEFLRERPSDDVGRAAGRIGDDQPDGARRIILSRSRR